MFLHGGAHVNYTYRIGIQMATPPADASNVSPTREVIDLTKEPTDTELAHMFWELLATTDERSNQTQLMRDAIVGVGVNMLRDHGIGADASRRLSADFRNADKLRVQRRALCEHSEDVKSSHSDCGHNGNSDTCSSS
jgi:hypothetical protein